MKTAYIAIKFYKDYRNKDLVDGISNILEKRGYETFCIVRDEEKGGKITFTPSELMNIAFNKIHNSDLMIVELSEKGVGIGIEAGYAFAKGIPIITIAKKGCDISSTLEGISKKIYYYEDIKEIEGILE